MRAELESNSTTHFLRFATVAEVVFLVISGLLLFTEHRAHYLGALPYAVLIVAVTVFLWFQSEGRKQGSQPTASGESGRAAENRRVP
jgi:hypothetical protein